MSRALKIVVTGPFGAGKTTLIKTISQITVLSTERSVTDSTRGMKGHTTVAMDFGRLRLGDALSLSLFGTPGQERFDFMWEILAEGMLGFVLLVDYGRPESFEEAGRILEFFTDIADVPFVVAVNKVAGVEDAAAEVRAKLDVPAYVPVVTADVREREGVKDVLIELLERVLAHVSAAPADVAEGGR